MEQTVNLSNEDVQTSVFVLEMNLTIKPFSYISQMRERLPGVCAEVCNLNDVNNFYY